MTIFSGVVAILSPTLMSRLPTYAADKTRGPCALGSVLERMQNECGVACTRTAENVCMVQGEWDAIRKAHSFLDHHDALNKMCRASSEPVTKKARRDRTPEPEAPVLATTASVPGVASPANQPSPKARSSSPSIFPSLPTAAASADEALLKRELGMAFQPQSPLTAAPPTTTTNTSIPTTASTVTSSTKNTGPSTPQHTSSPTPSGRSGAGKRKQGIPRKQVQNFGESDEDSSSELDVQDFTLTPVNASKVAQDSPGFPNGDEDSSIQIVATWGNFTEDNIGQLPQPKTEPISEDEENKHDSDRDVKGRLPSDIYTVQSDGQGGTVILPSVAEPVYVLNMSNTADDYSRGDTAYGYNNENIYHSSSELGDNKWVLKKDTSSPFAGDTNGKISNMSTARKSTTPRLTNRKSASQRTILLVTKKAAGQATQSQKIVKKTKDCKLSPQRRRGIIQGDSPVKGEYTCSYCQKVFNTKEAIKVHEEVYHTGRYKSMPSSSKSPLFECTQCGKSYMSKHALEEHLYTHVGMRPFACPFCAASFNHRKSLRRHVQLHNNVKRFDCPQCNKTFIRKDALESHLRIHKAEEEEVVGGSGSDANVDVTVSTE